MNETLSWDEYFIRMAQLISEKSKDRSTKVGAVVVGPDNEIRSTGFNGFPRNIDDENDSYHQRPLKYQVTEHAERNCCYHAARVGIPLKDCTLYLNFDPIPCTDCTRAIIQSGIVKIIGPNREFTGKGWSEDLEIAKNLLDEAGVEIKRIDMEENK